MSVARRWIAAGIVFLGAGPGLFPQTAASTGPAASAPSAASGQSGEKSRGTTAVPGVPGLSGWFDGFNAGVNYAGVHNSSVGWYTVATPAVSYTFSRHYSADAGASIYFRRMVENPNRYSAEDPELILDAVDASDTFLGFHASFSPEPFRDTLTTSLSLPTGNSTEGLGTGHVTYDFSNSLERSFNRVGLQLDLGGGNSSSLSNSIVNKDYSSQGPMLHFQAGTIFWWRENYLQTFAYEQLPVGSQKVYTSVSSTGERTTVFSSASVGEDNGLTSVVGIPLTSRLSVLSYYNRSLRRHSDTVSIGLSFVLRGSQKGKWMSFVDRALRDAESEPQ